MHMAAALATRGRTDSKTNTHQTVTSLAAVQKVLCVNNVLFPLRVETQRGTNTRRFRAPNMSNYFIILSAYYEFMTK